MVAELSKRLKSRREAISGKQKGDVQQSNKLEGVYGTISTRIPPSQNSSVSSDSGNVSDDEDWEADPEPIEQVSSGSQPLNKKRSESPDSSYGSGTTSPSHSTPKVEKPPIPPKPAGLQTKSEAPPVKEESPVSSEMKDPSTLFVKDHITKFGGEALRCQKENVVQIP